MQSMQWLLNALSSISYARDDLGARLGYIPDGKKRMNMLYGSARKIYHDLQGTIPDKQLRQIRNSAHDLEVRMVPKLTPQAVTVLLDKETAMELVDAAQVKCRDCVMDNEEARDCKLCKILEVMVPLSSYDSLLCPYSLATWEEK